MRRGLAIALLFAAAAVALTWPLATSPGRAAAVRGDAFVNVWNAWWVGHALEQGISPYRTEMLHHPLGVDLSRHTLSLANALPGSWLARAVGPHDASKLLLLLHFWLSGWFFYLFARAVVGHRPGAVVAGLLWTASPFHFYYLAQLNLATMEGLPLAGLAFVHCWRKGGVGPTLGVALAAAFLAVSCSYYLVYAGMLGVLLLLGGGLVVRDVPWRTGARRLAGAGLAATAAIVFVSWPTVMAAFGDGAAPAADPGHAARRSNTLAGFLWKGPPEELIVSWPTMLGYGTLVLLAAGTRGLREHGFWLGAAALFFALGLGPLFEGLPLLGMLRKPDRFFVMVQLCACVLAAAAWAELAPRVRAPAARRALGVLAALLLLAERAAVPLATWEVPISPAFAAIADDPSVEVVVHLPPQGYRSPAARRNLLQTVHGKAITEGYVTTLAITDRHVATMSAWHAAYLALVAGDPGPLRTMLGGADADLVVLHATGPVLREEVDLGDGVVRAPFALVAAPLVGLRQQGAVLDGPLSAAEHAAARRSLERAFGAPESADERVTTFRVRR